MIFKHTAKKFVGLLLAILVFGILTFKLQAQEVSIELGPNEIALNQAFTITITIKNERLQQYDKFPEIEGFVKRGTSSSSSTNIINRQITTTHSVIQNYVATEQGTFRLEPFEMEVNGKTYRSQGKTIQVGPAQQHSRRGQSYGYDPFEEFFGRRDAQTEEFVEVKDDAFFGLSLDKNKVYIGEGLTLTLAFYVARTNRAQLQFPQDISRQISDIIKEIKPTNAWEENFNIEQIVREPVMLGDKAYDQYKLYQASFFPLTTDTIRIPSVGLKMVKYKESTSRGFFGPSRQQDFKTYYTKAKTIPVKDLPPHPLKSSVSVGNFSLEEKIPRTRLETGEGLNYEFIIRGEGNIASIDAPKLEDDIDLEIYPPTELVNIERNYGKVSGNKTFRYFLVPNDPGEFPLDQYFQYVYFNPVKEKYDTLKPKTILQVKGESKRNEYITSNDYDSFYDLIDLQNNQLSAMGQDRFFLIFANLFIVVLLGLAAVVLFKTRM